MLVALVRYASDVVVTCVTFSIITVPAVWVIVDPFVGVVRVLFPVVRIPVRIVTPVVITLFVVVVTVVGTRVVAVGVARRRSRTSSQSFTWRSGRTSRVFSECVIPTAIRLRTV